MNKETYVAAECESWLLKYDPTYNRAFLSQVGNGDPVVIYLTLFQLPDLARALQGLHSQESSNDISHDRHT
ncbi:MAG: hypothetical protein PSU94_08175 [Lacunisphaera sp.]|nr:hypothetical protein [Lacunisphaera sp.]